MDILQPGPGAGGHCIPVDPWFIAHSDPERTPLIQAARKVNDAKPEWVARRAVEMCADLDGPVVACLGLAYKGDTGDLRESPSIAVVRSIRRMFPGTILVVEPHVDRLPDELLSADPCELVELPDAMERADVVVLLTDHSSFLEIDPRSLEGKKILDSRGVWAQP